MGCTGTQLLLWSFANLSVIQLFVSSHIVQCLYLIQYFYSSASNLWHQNILLKESEGNWHLIVNSLHEEKELNWMKKERWSTEALGTAKCLLWGDIVAMQFFLFAWQWSGSESKFWATLFYIHCSECFLIFDVRVLQ